MAGVPDDEDTVRIRPSAAPRLRRRRFLTPIAGGIALTAVAGGWFAWHRGAAGASGLSIDTGSEADIDGAEPCGTRLSYLSLDRNIVVIDFPDLATQGLTLDRVAAFVEKAATPRNRVLDDTDLGAAIAASGASPATYYYGHDYQAADLRRFFATAAAQNVTLNPHEILLRDWLTQLGWLAPGATGAIISLAAADSRITPDMRAVILHHEISHGAFYTVPEYRSYSEAFWVGLTEADRVAFTNFLGRQGYDTADTELMLNETQAYLVFTRDRRFFNAAAVGMTENSVTQLRESFIAGMPDFWLTPLAGAALPAGGLGSVCTAALQTRTCLCFTRPRRLIATG